MRAPRRARAPPTPAASGKPWMSAGFAGDRAKEHSVGPPRRARTPEPVHPARSPRQDLPVGHAVVDGKGLDGPALVDAQGLLRSHPVPADPHRHELQDSRDDPVSRSPRPRAGLRADPRTEHGPPPPGDEPPAKPAGLVYR